VNDAKVAELKAAYILAEARLKRGSRIDVWVDDRFWAARIMIGSAWASAARAISASPLSIASSTLRMKVRILLRRERFTAVRRAIFLTAFLAEAVFAILSKPCERSLAWRDQKEIRPPSSEL
jgi:hypothetical protein